MFMTNGALDANSRSGRAVANRRPRTVSRVSLIFVGLLAVSPSAWSYNFIPTTEEWATWPPYCRASYAGISYLKTREFGEQISQSEIDHWTKVLGKTASGLWHYCAGLAEYSRAMVETDPQQRLFNLREASNESLYMYGRLGPNDPLFVEIATFYAQTRFDLGEKDEAKQILTDAIKARPEVDRPYLVLSAMIRRSGNTEGAIDMLEQGNKATSYQSAEINYTLGLLYVDRHAYAPAQECAKRAYALGYPLPGLKKKLEKAGQWSSESEE